MIGPFPAYEGDEPYVFVCYAHEDSNLVFAQIAWLRERGINIWYDEGINPGKRWRDVVARAMEHAHAFLFFVSPRSIESDHCLREVDFALDSARSLLSVHIVETTLTPELSFRIGNVQAIHLFAHTGDDGRNRMAAALTSAISDAIDKAPPSRGGRDIAHAQREGAFREHGARSEPGFRGALTWIARLVFGAGNAATENEPFGRAAIAASIVGTICAVAMAFAPVRALEEHVGLRWLFALRGSVAPPDSVALVVMNQRTASNIALPRDPEQFHRCANPIVGHVPVDYVALPAMPSRWPRCLHARLVEKLAAAGAEVIAFDVVFRERPPLPGSSGDLNAWQDEDLATAIATAGRVVVAQKLEVVDGREQLSSIVHAIDRAAIGVAPFPLAVDSGGVARFPLFEESEVATPTLPAVALQAYARDQYPLLVDFVTRHARDSVSLLSNPDDSHRAGQLAATALLMRQLLRDAPELARAMRDEADEGLGRSDPLERAKVRALVALYTGENDRLLNFYGPPGTIATMDYDRVLVSAPETLASTFGGRAVFVGYAEADQPEQLEHFATALSSDPSADFSGVEIAATGFANLVQNTTIREMPFGVWLLVTFVGGFLSTLVCALLDALAALVRLASALLAFGVVVFVAFAAGAIWIPFVVPMLVAVPVGTLSSFGWKYSKARP